MTSQWQCIYGYGGRRGTLTVHFPAITPGAPVSTGHLNQKAGFLLLDYGRITRHRAPIPSERTATRPALAMVGPPLLCEAWRRPAWGETTMAPAFTPQPP